MHHEAIQSCTPDCNPKLTKHTIFESLPPLQGLVLSLGSSSPLGNQLTTDGTPFASKAGFLLEARSFPAATASSLQAQPALPLLAPGAGNNTLDSNWPDGWVSSYSLISTAVDAGAVLNLGPLARIPATQVCVWRKRCEIPPVCGSLHAVCCSLSFASDS